MTDGIYEIVENGKYGLAEAVYWHPAVSNQIQRAWDSGSTDLKLPTWLVRALDGGEFNIGKARVQLDDTSCRWFFLKDDEEGHTSCQEVQMGDWLIYRRWAAEMHHWKTMGNAKLLASIPEEEYIPIHPRKPIEKPDDPEHPLNRDTWIEGTGPDKGQAHSFTGGIRKVLDPGHPAIGIRRQPLSGPYDPDDMPAIFLMNWQITQEEADRGEAEGPRLVFTKKITRKDSESPDWFITTWGYTSKPEVPGIPVWLKDAKQRGAAIVKAAEKER